MTSEEYIEGLLKELRETKLRNTASKGIFRIKDEISNQIADAVKRYFADNPLYYAELNKCAMCANTWEVLVFFK